MSPAEVAESDRKFSLAEIEEAAAFARFGHDESTVIVDTERLRALAKDRTALAALRSEHEAAKAVLAELVRMMDRQSAGWPDVHIVAWSPAWADMLAKARAIVEGA